MIPGGGGLTFPGGLGFPGGGLTFPNVDTGALRSTASWFGTASAICQSDSSDLRAALESVGDHHGGWTGQARQAWNGAGARGVADLSRAADAMNQVSTTLTTLATTIDECRSRYRTAFDRMTTANTEAASAQSAMDNYVPHGNGAAVKQFFDQQSSKLADAQAVAGGAQGEVTKAIADALAAGQRAAAALSGIAGMAAGIGNFAGTTPVGSAGSGGEAPPDMNFLVLLLGSVTGNYSSGRAFEIRALQALGFPKNTELVNGRIPDGLSNGEMIEVKGVIYQYRSSQIEDEVAGANARGEPFELIVGPRTRVSGSLQEFIAQDAQYGGEIVRLQPDGSFTDYAGNPVVRAPNGGFMYQGPAPKGDGTLNNPRGLPPPEEVPAGTGAGTGDEVPPGEVPPEEPEVPEIPLP
jgi:hypothetical protein